MVAFSNTLDSDGDSLMIKNNFSQIEYARTLQLQIIQTDYTETLKNYLASIPQKVTIRWAASIGGQNTVQSASPVLNPANDVVYFASGVDGKLFALNTADGSQRWTFNYPVPASNPGRGSAVVGQDGVVYFPAAYSGANSNSGYLYAVNPDGTQKWKYDMTAGAQISYISPAITKDGDILVGNNGTIGALHLVDKTSGVQKAYVKPSGGILGAITVSQNNIAYGVTGNNGLVAFDLNNLSGVPPAPASKGTYKVENENNHYSSGSPAIDSDGNVIAAFNQKDGNDAAIVALNATSANIAHNSTVWEYLFTPTPSGDSKMEQFGVAIGADNTIYISGHETKQIYAITPNGTLKWIFSSTNNSVCGVPAIDNKGYLHFGDHSGNYYILKDNTSKPELVYKGKLCVPGVTASQIWSSPVIADDGTIYFSAQVSTIEGTTSSRLFKIQVTGATGPANSSWPMKGGNAQRTGLQCRNPATTISTSTPAQFRIFSGNKTIEVIASQEGEISIYNLLGKLILKQSLNKGQHSFDVPSSQTYLVKLGDKTNKIFVR
jgi:outer membrane protein assembly factor BamB